MARVVNKTTVAMVVRDELVVLQGFLEFEHKTEFEGVGDGEKKGKDKEEGKEVVVRAGEGMKKGMVPSIPTIRTW
jgi:hypothetical protein